MFREYILEQISRRAPRLALSRPEDSWWSRAGGNSKVFEIY